MAFWGIVLKSEKPFIHTYDSSKGRLHISQATLGVDNDLFQSKVTVQCNVGHKAPVFLCTLFPGKTESLSLDLEFKETQSVTFSVIGARSVHLAGYYAGGGVHLNSNDESEPDGEDIAYTETERSTDDDSLEDSFINDSDPSVYDDEVVETSKKKAMMGKRRRLTKKYQPNDEDKDHANIIADSDDEDDHEDKDFFTLASSLLNRKTNLKTAHVKANNKVGKNTSKTVIKSEDIDNAGDVELENKGKRKAGYDLSLDEVVADNGANLEKESKKPSKERSTHEANKIKAGDDLSTLLASELGSENGAQLNKKREEPSKEHSTHEAEKMSCDKEMEQLVAENQPKRKKKKNKKKIKVEENIDEQILSTDEKIGKVEIKMEPVDFTEAP